MGHYFMKLSHHILSTKMANQELSETTFTLIDYLSTKILMAALTKEAKLQDWYWKKLTSQKNLY